MKIPVEAFEGTVALFLLGWVLWVELLLKTFSFSLETSVFPPPVFYIFSLSYSQHDG